MNVLVFADQYRYGKAAFELAQFLDSTATPGIRADFANTENLLEPAVLKNYAVLVLFNHNNITAIHEKNISEFVAEGRGLVALHHVINKANGNPELTRLIGGFYTLEDRMLEHRDFNIVRIPGVEHPILEGIPEKFKVYDDQDFRMQFYPGEPVNKFLSCDLQENGPQEDCGWTRTEGAGRVVYLSPGDPVEKKPFLVNQPLTKLIVNAVRWAGGE
ncbi:MAG: hypothetical protein A3F83_05330 [Candidatus Glassbacteria bacterium RIFCSPLOWO2_12_FULL_58_11]|uniref:ThuA-like domain-containing protein n=1 Tax=Candidatus Glassbacteria bacterium RIFCSPLOWO2_12_FULL_58_11 TaxID=1817867 RepID=A0A1F5YPZ0_9BACT|nr:MAG: hypothetical protein A3F83_05330 [Candidatus Glassbacteria bacterium RIFCSPLOWO2_12_FULL_58_11]